MVILSHAAFTLLYAVDMRYVQWNENGCSDAVVQTGLRMRKRTRRGRARGVRRLVGLRIANGFSYPLHIISLPGSNECTHKSCEYPYPYMNLFNVINILPQHTHSANLRLKQKIDCEWRSGLFGVFGAHSYRWCTFALYVRFIGICRWCHAAYSVQPCPPAFMFELT